MFKLVKGVSLILVLLSLVYSSISDTITYRRKRGAPISKALLDVESGALRTITSDHSHTHNYEAFSLYYIDTLDAGETKMFAVLVDEGYDLHFKSYDIWTEKSPFRFTFIENPDIIRLSTDTVYGINRNREDNLNNINFPSNTCITDSVDTLEGGFVLDSKFLGGGSGVGGSSFAGAISNTKEWIFGDNQYVIFTLHNESGDASRVSVDLFWYEVKEND